MRKGANHFRLDWRQEMQQLGPFLCGKGGVVRIDFQTEKAAQGKFSHLLKEDFIATGNGRCFSIRFDDKWSTTFTVDDQIAEFAEKLSNSGIEVKFERTATGPIDYLSNNSVEGDFIAYAPGAVFVNGFDQSAYAQRKRVAAICDGVRRFVAAGGRLMLVINDMPHNEQQPFWTRFWNAGLAEAGGENLLLIYFTGPKCGTVPHDDAPSADLHLRLPEAISGDQKREDEVYDDIIDVFRKSGLDGGNSAVIAESILDLCGESVLAIQEGLSKKLQKMQQRANGGGG